MKELFELVRLYPNVRFSFEFDPVFNTWEIQITKIFANEVMTSKLKFTDEYFDFEDSPPSFINARILDAILKVKNKLPSYL